MNASNAYKFAFSFETKSTDTFVPRKKEKQNCFSIAASFVIISVATIRTICVNERLQK